MNPRYGSDIRRFLFEPLDYASAGSIKQEIRANIRDTLDRFEPRISVLDIKCTPNFDDNGFDVVLQYNVRGTDDPPVAVEFFLSRTR